MAIDTKDVKTDVLLNLLSEARAEADNLRGKLEKYEHTLLATRLIMGHEIKRPATAISGYLDLALEDLEMWAGCEAVENVKKARSDCELLNELNTYYLELLRIDNGEAASSTEAQDLVAKVAPEAPAPPAAPVAETEPVEVKVAEPPPEAEPRSPSKSKQEILQMVERGEISVEEAVKLLQG